jgi:hypothetical protein
MTATQRLSMSTGIYLLQGRTDPIEMSREDAPHDGPRRASSHVEDKIEAGCEATRRFRDLHHQVTAE